MTLPKLEYKAIIENISTLRANETMTAFGVPYTPSAIIEDITSRLPIHKDSSVAVMFTIEWAIYLKQFHEVSDITVIVDAEDKIVRNLCKHLGFDYVVYYKGLEMKKFDVVVGNPPFQETNDSSSYTNLWSQVYTLSFSLLNDNGWLGMIHPKTWATSKQEGRESQTSEVQRIIAQHGVHVNIDECSKHFPSIGSTFSYSVVTKSHTLGQPISIESPNGKFSFDNFPEIINRLPKNISQETLSIFDKVFKGPFFTKMSKTTPSGDMIHDRDRNDENKDEYKYRVQYSAGTVKWCKTPNRYQNDKKVLWPNQTTHNFPIYDDGISAPPNRGAVYLVDSRTEGENLVKFVQSKLLQFVVREQRFHHGVLNTNVISSIPKIDISRTYTDEEIYSHFNLTQDEINYIEKNI